MNKEATVTMRVKIYHKESMKDWAKRLKISLTQLYMILVGQVGPADLSALVLTEFARKHLQRLGLPSAAIPIMETSPHASSLFYFLLSCSAKLELAEHTGDLETAAYMSRQIEMTEDELIRAFGAAVKKYYPQAAE